MANRIKKNEKKDFPACKHFQTIRKHGANTYIHARIKKIKKIKRIANKEVYAEQINLEAV